MARLAKLVPDLLDEEQKRLYETITAGPRADGRQSFQLVDGAGALEGPFNAMLLRPALGSALQALRGAVKRGRHRRDASPLRRVAPRRDESRAGTSHLLGCGAVQVVFGFTPR